MKVVINTCYGGFGLSDAASEECIRRGMGIYFRPNPTGTHYGKYSIRDFEKREFRTHPTVVTVVEEMGEASWGTHAKLRVIDIPFNNCDGWEIEEYDGYEFVAEKHKTWP